MHPNNKSRETHEQEEVCRSALFAKQRLEFCVKMTKWDLERSDRAGEKHVRCVCTNQAWRNTGNVIVVRGSGSERLPANRVVSPAVGWLCAFLPSVSRARRHLGTPAWSNSYEKTTDCTFPRLSNTVLATSRAAVSAPDSHQDSAGVWFLYVLGLFFF